MLRERENSGNGLRDEISNPVRAVVVNRPLAFYPITTCKMLKQGVPGVKLAVTNWFMGKKGV